MKILVINAGSSSLKYQLFNMDDESVMAKGLCERIGIDGHLKHTPLLGDKPVFNEDLPLPTHSEAIAAVIDKLTSKEYGVVSSMSEIDAVGHRVVHGGEYFSSSVVVDDSVVDAIEACIPLAPLHNPAAISGIKACREVMGDVPMVTVFDTAFHQTMPAKAYTYAVPHQYYVEDKIRRYGFHGTSHRYVAGRAIEMMGGKRGLKLISCHMGNGSSITAICDGKSVDTSMGFTPLAGLPMGTRSGDLDSGVLQYLMNKYDFNIDEMLNILNKKSGVLGVSGISSDFRDLESAEKAGNELAGLALELFSYDAAKIVGSYAAAMNGVDGIIFTAGVGENSPTTRKAICDYLGFLGCAVDDAANSQRGKEIFINTPDSKVKLMVIPTNEELVIARDTQALVK